MQKIIPAIALFLAASSASTAWGTPQELKDFYLETKAAHRYVCDPITAADMTEAQRAANHLLANAENFTADWNYSNAKHEAYLILGRLDLVSGNLEGAKANLLNAGSVAGSPQLDSFGPNMTLAKELLIKKERAAVLAYFDLVEKFWRPVEKDRLPSWKAQVAAGQIPEFGANLVY
jgi:hypothetical protein